jgi:hypothetical protein
MTNLAKLEALNEAIILLGEARRELAEGSMTLWQIVNHAKNHLEKQMVELLAPLPEEIG